MTIALNGELCMADHSGILDSTLDRRQPSFSRAASLSNTPYSHLYHFNHISTDLSI